MLKWCLQKLIIDKKILWIGLALFLNGCAGSVGESSGDFCLGCDVVLLTSLQTSDGGVVVADHLSGNDLKAKRLADANCQVRLLGSLASFTQTITGDFLTKDRYQFSCSKHNNNNNKQQPDTSIIEEPKSIESAQPNPASSQNISLQNVKRKCEQLGFKPKTEKFGSCVLELTK